MSQPKGEAADKTKRRKRKHKVPKVRISIDHYFCTKCDKEHWKGITPRLKFAKHYIMFRRQEIPQGKLPPKVDTLPKELPPVSFDGKKIPLNTQKRSAAAERAEQFLKARVVGQDHAVSAFVDLIAKVDADVCDPYKPRGIYLLLGPTGVGKTRIVEALAENYFSSRKKMVKINCGEMATMFSFKKFSGRLFYDENITLNTKSGKPLGLILFDEIEKATKLLYKVLMGILDRASLHVDDQEVDLSHTVIVMTSNLGADDIMKHLAAAKNTITPEVRKKMHRSALDAARARFTPEFFNRLDEVLVFNPLLKETLRQIVGMEIAGLEQRLIAHDIRLQCSDLATDLIVKEGTDLRYGARHLRRTVEQMIVKPIAHMITAGELKDHARLMIQVKDGRLNFCKVVKEKK